MNKRLHVSCHMNKRLHVSCHMNKRLHVSCHMDKRLQATCRMYQLWMNNLLYISYNTICNFHVSGLVVTCPTSWHRNHRAALFLVRLAVPDPVAGWRPSCLIPRYSCGLNTFLSDSRTHLRIEENPVWFPNIVASWRPYCLITIYGCGLNTFLADSLTHLLNITLSDGLRHSSWWIPLCLLLWHPSYWITFCLISHRSRRISFCLISRCMFGWILSAWVPGTFSAWRPFS
jgi:hypothetical protein